MGFRGPSGCLQPFETSRYFWGNTLTQAEKTF